MADGADPHPATGAPRRAGYGRAVAPLTAPEPEGLGLPRFGIGPLRDDVAVGPHPASRADVVSRRGHRRRLRRSGAGSQASSSASPAPTMYGGGATSARRLPLETRWVTRESGEQYLQVGISSHRRQSILSQFQASSSAAPAPSSDHRRAEGGTRVRQSVLYSDRPRHSRPRRQARAEASVVRSSQLDRPVMDLPSSEALSLSDPSLSTPETTEMTISDHPVAQGAGTGTHVGQSVPYLDEPRQDGTIIPALQEKPTCEVKSSEVDREVTEEAPSLSDPQLLTSQTETDEESTDDDCASLPTTGQTEYFFNRPTGISLSMLLSKPILRTIPNVKEQRPKPYSDVDPKDVQREVKEYLDGRPCIDLNVASDSFLAGEDPTLINSEFGTEPQLPGVITEQASFAAAHPQQSMVPTESRHETSTKEIIPNGTPWMDEEVMLCFKKFIKINPDLAELEDYRLDELQHQCFNVESYEKVYHHYNFTVRMKMPDSADWKVKLYFAEVKEIFREKYYLCYPLQPDENGQCYACKSQGVEDLRHPAIDLFEIGSPDTLWKLWFTDDEEDEEATSNNLWRSWEECDSLDLGLLFDS